MVLDWKFKPNHRTHNALYSFLFCVPSTGNDEVKLQLFGHTEFGFHSIQFDGVPTWVDIYDKGRYSNLCLYGPNVVVEVNLSVPLLHQLSLISSG